jgi:methionyl aminopeptidase
MRPELKSKREIELMREAGKIVAEALNLCKEMAKPGVRTIDINDAVEQLYTKYGAISLFKGYPGRTPFPAVICSSLNEQVVHGIPGNRELKEGDLFKIDTACKLNGWCADAAVTVPIGAVTQERSRLIIVAQEVLQIAIDQMAVKKKWTEVSRMMQQHTEKNGYSVVDKYVGHGIGREMHEYPQVPNFVDKEMKQQDFRLEPGLVLAVEPMINMGIRETRVLLDHWTVETKDRLPSAHVEHTIAITDNGVEVLTRD